MATKLPGYPFGIILIILLLATSFLSACEAVKAPAFPEALFQHDEPQSEADKCFVQVEQAEVKIPEGKQGIPVLQIGGQITSTCGQMQVKIAKPDLKNEIAVDLAAEPGPGDQDLKEPFYISISLENLWSASFTVVINGNRRVPFVVP